MQTHFELFIMDIKCVFSCREIASAIKLLLDSVNDVLKNYTSTGRMMEHKRVSCAGCHNAA